jgi:hypothetical protein
VKGVGFVAFGSVVVLGHVLPLFGFTWFDEEEVGGDVPADAEPLTANRQSMGALSLARNTHSLPESRFRVY